MKLTVIGSSGSMPAPGNPASCYLVEAAGRRIVLDLGNGSLGELARHVSLDEVDAVLLSHLHADHCLDLCAYYVYRRYHPDGPRPPLAVHGPVGTAERLARAYDLDEGAGMADRFDFHEWGGAAEFEVAGLRVSLAPVLHPVPAFAIRVEYDEASLVYSGDTAACEALVVLARGADVFLAEASFHEGRDHHPDLHMTGRDAGEMAAKAGVGRLLLTHLPPWNDPVRSVREARATWDGPLHLARPGDRFVVGAGPAGG